MCHIYQCCFCPASVPSVSIHPPTSTKAQEESLPRFCERPGSLKVLHSIFPFPKTVRFCTDISDVIPGICWSAGSLLQVFQLLCGPLLPKLSKLSLSPGICIVFHSSCVSCSWCCYHLVSLHLSIWLPLLVHHDYVWLVSHHSLSVCIWKSHRILAWSLSTTLGGGSCLDLLSPSGPLWFLLYWSP